MKRFIAMILGLAVLHAPQAAEPTGVKKELGVRTMNTVSFDQYEGFWKKWRLLTARYRVDNNEIRVTYANDVAQKAIDAGKTDFPDGAVFGKVVWTTQADPTYPNSLQPQYVKRFTLMVKDKTHVEHRGWRYAIFDPKGKAPQDNHTDTVNACAQCHEYAAPRGFVFLGSIDPGAALLAAEVARQSARPSEPQSAGLVDMKIVSANDVPKPLRHHLPPNTDKVIRIGASLSETRFVGTANELIPLEINASAGGIPAAWWNDSGEVFSLAHPSPGAPTCMRPGGTTPGKPFATVERIAVGEAVFTTERQVCQ